jgi:hypothetical protein
VKKYWDTGTYMEALDKSGKGSNLNDLIKVSFNKLSLLDYRRGVPVARPHGGQDKGRNGSKVIKYCDK